MIESFDWRTLQLVRSTAPSIPTVYLTQEQKPEENIYRDQPSPWTAGFDPLKYAGSVPRAVKAAGGAIWSPLYEDIDSASIKEAHKLGLKVVVWTVNKAEDMARLMDMGVDGIISDNPDVLRRSGEEGLCPARARAGITLSGAPVPRETACPRRRIS